MSHQHEPVLFPTEPLRTGHRHTVELLCKPSTPPEGGPWCVCAAAAIRALQAGAPAPCDDMPWRCPFTSQNKSTPIT